MKITKRQLRRIIKKESALIEAYISMSSSGKAIANSIKGKFMRMYPDAKVGIDTREGWITVNGEKAVNMSQASGSPLTDEEMIEKMHSVYAGKQVDDDVGTEARRGTRPGEHKLDFGKDIGTYNYRSEGANMKITKRQLRRIIKEEKARLHEYGDQQQSAADRAINTYFDVRMMESLTSLMDDMFHNAMEAAIEDGMFDEEAHDAVLAGIRKLVEGELKEMRH